MWKKFVITEQKKKKIDSVKERSKKKKYEKKKKQKVTNGSKYFNYTFQIYIIDFPFFKSKLQLHFLRIIFFNSLKSHLTFGCTHFFNVQIVEHYQFQSIRHMHVHLMLYQMRSPLVCYYVVLQYQPKYS